LHLGGAIKIVKSTDYEDDEIAAPSVLEQMERARQRMQLPVARLQHLLQATPSERASNRTLIHGPGMAVLESPAYSVLQALPDVFRLPEG
jgi:hypothetical protein